MAKVKRDVSHARELQVLAYLLRRSGGCGEVAASISRTARDTGLSRSEARGALRRVADNGLVEVLPQQLPNGSSAENVYRFTQAGLEALALAVCDPPPAPRAAQPMEAAAPAARTERRYL